MGSKEAERAKIHSKRLSLSDTSDVGAARRLAIALANELNLSNITIDKTAIVVTELATNLIKHAIKNAQLLIQPIEINNNKGLQIIALDKGVGMSNIAEYLKDGYSTTATSGTGLGAITRLADLINIYSLKNVGTLIRADIWDETYKPLPSLLEIGNILLPHPGEEFCGDSWAAHQTDMRSIFLVADGLGHGVEASRASELACKIFYANLHLAPGHMVNLINEGLRKTRGAAIAVAEIDKTKQIVRFSALGNICSKLISSKTSQYMISHDGTAGLGRYTVREFTYPWHPEMLLIMHSDGITSRWDLKAYPGLSSRSSAVIAGIIFRDFYRGHDDVTVLVARKLADDALGRQSHVF